MRVRELAVVRREEISPRMVRLVLGGEALDGFTSLAPDDHLKLRLPAPDGTVVMRDYTPRRFDPVRRELAIEFVLHGDGPAATWARDARVGDAIAIGGPRGSRLLPERDGLLLIGDETALPAIGRWLEELRPGARALAIVEVADAREMRRLPSAGNAEVAFVSRNGAEAGGADALLAALDEAVARRAVPPGRVQAWVATEIEVARRLRTRLLDAYGFAREDVVAAGYWRHGIADGHGKIED
ncbi:MAG: siderophore-interacting protein [Gluconacetobacter diazotrophicus]|nr:siderophore-interacting protein [Gluconacetobacter diazotrophicus]